MKSRPDGRETRQPRLVQRSDHAHPPRCCPMGFQQGQQVEPLPHRRARHREEPREAVAPVRQVRHVAQQHVNQQRRIHLPAHRVGAVAEEAGEFEALFDLFEKHLDVPAAAVEVGYGLRTPLEVVGDENHHPPLAVHLHPGLDAAHSHALVLRAGQRDDLILDDVLPAFGEGFDHPVFHVVLGAGDPLHAAGVEVGQMGEIDVGLVEHHDFAIGDARADFAGALVVVVLGAVDDGEGWQVAVQVEPQVHLGGGLAAAVFGPVHAVGDELHGGGVHGMDPDFETPQQTLALAAAGEIRARVLEMAEGGPEEFFDEQGVALLVGVGDGVARRRGDAEAGERRAFEPQPIAEIVEADGVGELGEKHRGEMAGDAEGAGLRIDSRLAGVASDQMARNEIEDLLENDHIRAGWCLFVHTPLPSGRDFKPTPARFQTSKLCHPVGWL